jgi:hypothetical protein
MAGDTGKEPGEIRWTPSPHPYWLIRPHLEISRPPIFHRSGCGPRTDGPDRPLDTGLGQALEE